MDFYLDFCFGFKESQNSNPWKTKSFVLREYVFLLPLAGPKDDLEIACLPEAGLIWEAASSNKRGLCFGSGLQWI